MTPFEKDEKNSFEFFMRRLKMRDYLKQVSQFF